MQIKQQGRRRPRSSRLSAAWSCEVEKGSEEGRSWRRAAGGGRCVRAQAKGAINQEAVDLAPGFWFLRDVSPFARLAFKVAFLSIPLPTPHALTARQAPRCSNTPARPGSHPIFGPLPATPDSDSAGWPHTHAPRLSPKRR